MTCLYFKITVLSCETPEGSEKVFVCVCVCGLCDLCESIKELLGLKRRQIGSYLLIFDPFHHWVYVSMPCLPTLRCSALVINEAVIVQTGFYL